MKAGPKQLRRWRQLLASNRRSSSSSTALAMYSGGSSRGKGRGRVILEAIENPKAGLLDQFQDVSDGGSERSDVPKGCLAVYVGLEMRRFVIPTSYLCSPDFRVLLERAVDEFGFEQKGALRIPCEEEAFEDLIRSLNCKSSKKKVRRK